METAAQVHNVTSISAAYEESGTTKWVEVLFIDKVGNRFSFTAFVDKPLAIEGAELVALMAAGDAAQEGSLVPLLQASIEAAKAKKEAAHG